MTALEPCRPQLLFSVTCTFRCTVCVWGAAGERSAVSDTSQGIFCLLCVHNRGRLAGGGCDVVVVAVVVVAPPPPPTTAPPPPNTTTTTMAATTTTIKDAATTTTSILPLLLLLLLLSPLLLQLLLQLRPSLPPLPLVRKMT